MKVTVLGGCGAIGSIAVHTLVSTGLFQEVVIADINVEKARMLASKLAPGRVSAVKVDAGDPDSIRKAVEGSTVVLNCVGPFYKYGPTVLGTVIEAGINYVDICDDYDATGKLLEMDSKAREKGVSALIGMGSSPGISNVIVRFCADNLLDEVESIDIYHAHGGEKVEGPAVVKHRIHSMMIDIPVFLDGEFKTVRLFEESGRMLEEEVEFPGIGKYRVYAYPHPETITLPRYIKGVKRVTNLGLVLPPAYAELIKSVVRLGMVDEKPITVGDCQVSPLDFAVAFILSQREKLLKEAGITEPMGCLMIVVKGKLKGKGYKYVFSMYSRGKGMGAGTGIPAALGTILMAQGKINRKGVFPPEAGVDPRDIFSLASKYIKIDGKSGFPINVERIDEEGNVEKLSIESLFQP